MKLTPDIQANIESAFADKESVMAFFTEKGVFKAPKIYSWLDEIEEEGTSYEQRDRMDQETKFLVDFFDEKDDYKFESEYEEHLYNKHKYEDFDLHEHCWDDLDTIERLQKLYPRLRVVISRRKVTFILPSQFKVVVYSKKSIHNAIVHAIVLFVEKVKELETAMKELKETLEQIEKQ